MNRTRSMWFCGCLGIFSVFRAHDASASLELGVTLTELAQRSTAVAEVTALESKSEWEGTRIVTFSRVHVDKLVAGRTETTEPVVKTLGGTVGTIGQIVEGEAVLAPGTKWVLFLRTSPDGTSSVTARAQGQYLLSAQRLSQSPNIGHLLDRRGAVVPRTAVSDLDGRSVESAERAIAAAWGATHAL
jgi:hypothetical protein